MFRSLLWLREQIYSTHFILTSQTSGCLSERGNTWRNISIYESAMSKNSGNSGDLCVLTFFMIMISLQTWIMCKTWCVVKWKMETCWVRWRWRNTGQINFPHNKCYSTVCTANQFIFTETLRQQLLYYRRSRHNIVKYWYIDKKKLLKYFSNLKWVNKNTFFFRNQLRRLDIKLETHEEKLNDYSCLMTL